MSLALMGGFFISTITIARLARPVTVPGQDFHPVTGAFQLMHIPLNRGQVFVQEDFLDRRQGACFCQ